MNAGLFRLPGSILRHAGGAAVVGLLGALCIFAALRLGPGDPALTALGEGATPAAVAAYRARWGLDQPWPIQFDAWLRPALQGDFGTSIVVASGIPVSRLIADRLPVTAFVGVYALVLAIATALVAGAVAARWRGRWPDSVATTLAVLGVAMPDFWVAYLLIGSLGFGLGLFPSFGYVAPSVSLSGALSSATLPALAIAAPMAASFTRILRAALIEEALSEHVRVARALGHPGGFIFRHHILRNALIPFVTVVGLQVRYLLGGTVVIERIFGLPGLGALMVDAAFARDYPLVQACALVFLLGVLAANLATDGLCAVLDPRRS
ncbi:ABC transporter permease [Methylobacterium aquaticum]|uniref:ABC-type dipeptide/oligopeptide/nickel transport systems, permease components n=1 Tax=Methylobacterium aquaticum TaxID=270351 RepID=A0A0C6FAQ3_9HYPH|nr:ABC transporter permease [Methylobacterium aquaticum]BAQ49816.1 ABC-type dipeptide/oligopeptide/nickel transport systems, permease components [Methylobacterium aquaticum]